MKYQVFGILWTVFNLALMLVMGIVGIYLLWLVIKALRVYINSHEVRVEKKATRKSLAEALREDIAPEKRAQYLDIILDESDRMGALVGEMLES